jgi:hypothetical protein
MAEVRAAAANITLNPHLARAFRGGAPEVSVFWVDEDGLPCKCRYDFLKPRTIVNLKKFANQRQRPVDLAIHLAISEYRYDLQAKHYLDGYPHLFAAARAGRVFGDCPLPSGWERQLCEPETIVYSWVFHQMDVEPETAADTLIMAAMAATLMNVGNNSEGPEVAQDLKLAEEFAWKVVRGVERIASPPIKSLELELLVEHDEGRPFAVRAEQCRDAHKRLVASGRIER